MVKIISILLSFLAIVTLAVGLPAPDEERYLDKEYVRELVGWLSSLNSLSSNNPCHYSPNGNYIGSMRKRNSELINSLLSIPKNMNDAGK